MKYMGLALAFLVFAGTASAAIFAPPSAPKLEVTAKAQSAAISPAHKSTAPATMGSGRAPVPYTPRFKPPAPQIAALTEPPPTPAETQPTPVPEAKAPQPKPEIGRATAREVRNLSEARCGGRAITSIAVLPDGTVHVQC
jgi:hypothetical protein